MDDTEATYAGKLTLPLLRAKIPSEGYMFMIIDLYILRVEIRLHPTRLWTRGLLF